MDRGLLRKGMMADMVIFDDRTIADRATFQQPKQYASGIDYVIVNGQIAIEKGKHSGIRAGRILRIERKP
jgi:N-acyl-D-aspartate/D-glutamate deacylase